MKISNKIELQQIASNHSSDIDFKDFMKFYKDYNKEPYSFLVNDTTPPSDNYDLGRSYYKKNVLSEKDLLEKAATMKRFKYSPLGKLTL